MEHSDILAINLMKKSKQDAEEENYLKTYVLDRTVIL